MTFVRWLGAYRNGPSLSSSMEFELGGHHDTWEVACEWIDGGIESSKMSPYVKIGLTLGAASIKKKFNGDCWSVAESNGYFLMKMRNPRKNKNPCKEAWAVPDYTAIVVRGRVKKSTNRIVHFFAKKYGLPIIRIP